MRIIEGGPRKKDEPTYIGGHYVNVVGQGRMSAVVGMESGNRYVRDSTGKRRGLVTMADGYHLTDEAY